MLKSLFNAKPVVTDPIKHYYDSRFEVYYDDHHKGWAVRYQADQSLENDWFSLNKEGKFENYFYTSHKVHYYRTEFAANEARKEFIIRKCVESYEYKLRRASINASQSYD